MFALLSCHSSFAGAVRVRVEEAGPRFSIVRTADLADAGHVLVVANETLTFTEETVAVGFVHASGLVTLAGAR